MTDPWNPAANWYVGTPSAADFDEQVGGPINTLGHNTGTIALSSPLLNWDITSLTCKRIGNVAWLWGSVQRVGGGSVAADGTWITNLATLPSGQGFAPLGSDVPIIFAGTSGTPSCRFDFRVNQDRTIDLRCTGGVALPQGGFATVSGMWFTA